MRSVSSDKQPDPRVIKALEGNFQEEMEGAATYRAFAEREPDPGRKAILIEMAEQEERHSRPLFLISGMINTKDQTGYFHAFEGMARHVFTVPVNMSDAGVPADELAARAMEAGLSAEPVASVENALKLLRDTWDDAETPPRILIGGSLYLAGEVLAANGTPPT